MFQIDAYKMLLASSNNAMKKANLLNQIIHSAAYLMRCKAFRYEQADTVILIVRFIRELRSFYGNSSIV